MAADMERLSGRRAPEPGSGGRRAVERVALVVVRDSRGHGLQVLLSSTVADAGAGAGALAFPAGRVDRHDRGRPMLLRCCGLTGARARRLLGHEMSPAQAMGCWVAGARVLLGATGILFAVRAEGRTPVRRRLPPAARSAASRGAPDFAALLARERLHCDLSRLRPFAHWADPGGADPGAGSASSLFLTQVPAGAGAAGSVWRAPEKALVSWRDGKLALDFETFACLRTLTDFPSAASLLSEYADGETP